MGKNVGNKSIVTACTQRVNAIKKYLTAKDEIFVNGEQVKGSTLAAVYQDALDTRASAGTAQGEYKTALVARNTAEAKRLAVDVALQPYVVQRFGPSSTEAHDFGYVPRKVTEKSPVTKAKASLLGKATRDARGTMSEKQKRNIKGSLDPATAAAIEALAGSTPPVATSSSPLSPAPTPVVAAPPVAPVVTTSALNGSAHN